MMAGWAVILAAFLYLGLLFAIANWGDHHSSTRLLRGRMRSSLYALALAVYCTSWTFYGSVGLASRSGLDFLTIYIGPILVVGLGAALITRIVQITKSQNITSVADFVAARYGKSERVAALVCLIAVIGSVPYIALQLKAVSGSLGVLLAPHGFVAGGAGPHVLSDLALWVAIVLAGFSVAFGTRHTDATEHQDGLLLAISFESFIKLIAFLAVGFYVTFSMFGGWEGFITALGPDDPLGVLIGKTSETGSYLILILLAGLAALLLPRQFHMMVIENRGLEDIKRAAWLFPLYLVAINLFVIPLALAGQAVFPAFSADRDMTVLNLPLSQGAHAMAMVAFIGGLSAATAMVIVESIALAIMISNHLVMPIVLRLRGFSGEPSFIWSKHTDFGGFVLAARRIAIIVVVFLGYAYYWLAGDVALASIGLLSFAAIAQIAPSFLGGLIWRHGTASGAIAGLMTGLALWAYTLLLPSLAPSSGIIADILRYGPFEIAALKPTALFGLDWPRLTHGVIISLSANILAYIVFSRLYPGGALERLQSAIFAGRDEMSIAPSLRLWWSSVTVDDLKATVARYLGEERTEKSFAGFATSRAITLNGPDEADIHLVRYAEHLLASAIGAASSQLALSLLLRRRNVSTEDALKLLDDASSAMQQNHQILQDALDHARQGITVLDKDLRLLHWNRAFRDLYNFPPDLLHVGVGLDEVVRFNAERGAYGPGKPDELVAARLHSFMHDIEPVSLRLYPSRRVIEIRSNHLPNEGIITTYTDVTEAVAAKEALERANETLERNVRDRTEELTATNEELKLAKAEADEANISKTRFLAAASHDILQPLNAARLYAASLVERDRDNGDYVLAENIDASLDAVEEILTALLDISRLDTGVMRVELSTFPLNEIFKQLQREFDLVAKDKNLRLTFVPTSLSVRSDRRLLRRLVQNLVSNALKYTPRGRVLIGVRRKRGRVRIGVWDTGIGIPLHQQKLVFQEFQRLDQGAKVAKGLGLGLSIVERIAKILNHPLALHSEPGKGSYFEIDVPFAVSLPVADNADAPLRNASMPLRGLQVLTIDNEPAILEGMRDLLTRWGCIVMTAKDGKEALAALHKQKIIPDVVIADYHLDEGDGLEAITSLRWKTGHDFPAILITADRTIAVQEAAHAKSVHLLNKPVKPASLRSLLAQWRAQAGTDPQKTL
jgi:Na+/proline symporter/signal transduction histidine kinase/CheY-like chemotaxis protein